MATKGKNAKKETTNTGERKTKTAKMKTEKAKKNTHVSKSNTDQKPLTATKSKTITEDVKTVETVEKRKPKRSNKADLKMDPTQEDPTMPIDASAKEKKDDKKVNMDDGYEDFGPGAQ